MTPAGGAAAGAAGAARARLCPHGVGAGESIEPAPPQMLDWLLGCGRHLPVLALALSWAPPSAWLRLRFAARGLREALPREQLQELAAKQTPPGGSLSEVIGDALEAAALGKADAELLACEAAFAALLLGADANEPAPMTGITPLMMAAEEGQRRLCELLLAHGADADRASVGGSTALGLTLGGCPACPEASECGGKCQRPATARLLLWHTREALPESLRAAVRMALQDLAYLPVVKAFAEERGVDVNEDLAGPDGRQGTALSCALERRVDPVEGPLAHRPEVVGALLALGADAGRPGPYTAWWGGASASCLLQFATVNGCDAATLRLLGGEQPPAAGAAAYEHTNILTYVTYMT